MNLSFLGAAREVTGSCYLLEVGGTRFLVDCGMFQGGREARAKNRHVFGFDPATIDFVLLTHAHIDHSGLLPRLVTLGFKGFIYATGATCDLLTVMLPDAGYIQEREAENENRRRFKSRKRLRNEMAPLYTVEQARRCLKRVKAVDYDHEFTPHPAVRCRFRDAGHILGSAIAELWVGEGARRRKIVFSGDLGQPARPLVRDPTFIADADWLVVESTYGNRLHKSMQETEDELVHAVIDTIERKGGNLTNWLEYFVTGFLAEMELVMDKIKPFIYSGKSGKKTKIILSRDEIKILDFLQETNSVSSKDIEDILTVSKRTAQRYLAGLIKKGLIKKHGDKKSSRYTL